MNKKMEKNDAGMSVDDIHIDYDHLDVADIMDQVKIRIEARPQNHSGSEAFPPSESDTNIPESHEHEPVPSKAKRILLKIMKPFFPLIKLLVLPIHQDLRETIHNLDNTNKRLDVFSESVNHALEEIKTHLNRFNSETIEDLTTIKEYTKLLHGLSHNIVVEMTKLKIEEENIKIKIRILEKDFEHLKSREKALESRIIQ